MAPTPYETKTLFTPNPVELLNKSKVKFQSKPETSLQSDQNQIPQYQFKDIVWKNVIIFIILHTLGAYSIYVYLFKIKWITFIFGHMFTAWPVEGVGAGAHRLWAHRTYKAKLPLRIFLMIGHSIAGQNNILEWTRDHRVHHKFVDTNADPHNSLRGFFFSHIGWLMVRKHKDVSEKGKTVDLSDLRADPVVMFQKKYYYYLFVFFSIILPTFVPWYYLGDTLENAFFSCVVYRYLFCLHGTWLVNSAAHMWGTKPYDKSIQPVENMAVSALTWGEGWHNYHHVFPWDYKAAELGNYTLNMTTGFIDLMAKIGQAYDRKSVSPDMVKKRVQRTGDGTKKFDIDGNKKTTSTNEVLQGNAEINPEEGGEYTIWGWGDQEMEPELISKVIRHNNLTGL